MNIRLIESQLNEALEQLQETVQSIKSGEIDELKLQLDIEHVYHHLNTAWNARYASEKESAECSESNFNKWRQFPTDLEFLE